MVFQSLTRPDPTLQLLVWSPAAARTFSHIGGRITGGVGFPEPANYRTVTAFVSGSVQDSGLNYTGANSTYGDYTLNVQMTHSSATGIVHALQMDMGASPDQHGPQAYVGYGSRSNVSVTVGLNASGQDVQMGTFGTDSIRGTFLPPSGYNVGAKYFTPSFGPMAAVLGPQDGTLWIDHTPGPGFMFRTAKIGQGDPLSYAVTGDASNAAGAEVFLTKTGLLSGASEISIVMPTGLELLSPADGATGVNTDTEFRWTGPSKAVYLWLLPAAGPPGSGGTYVVVTSATALRIPKINMPGFPLHANFGYAWFLLAYGPFASLDSATGANGFLSAGDNFLTSAPSRNIVAGP